MKYGRTAFEVVLLFLADFIIPLTIPAYLYFGRFSCSEQLSHCRTVSLIMGVIQTYIIEKAYQKIPDNTRQNQTKPETCRKPENQKVISVALSH